MTPSSWQTVAAAAQRMPPIAAIGLALALIAAMMLAYFGMRPSIDPTGADAQRTAAAAARAMPPAPPPFLIRPVPAATAVEINAQIPLSDSANPSARGLSFAGRAPIDRQRALACLTSAIYYEAASESDDGLRAVAQVVLNRVRHPAFPSTVCGVIYQGSERVTGCQFTFTCDGSLRRQPDRAGWRRAQQAAAAALAGGTFAPVGLSTHYHTNWVVPYWAKSLTKAAVVGTHIFYRWRGWWGQPPAFRSSARGAEPDIAARTLQETEATEIDLVPVEGIVDLSTILPPAIKPRADDSGGAPLADAQAGKLALAAPIVGAAPPTTQRSLRQTSDDGIGSRACAGSQSQARSASPAKPVQPDQNKSC